MKYTIDETELVIRSDLPAAQIDAELGGLLGAQAVRDLPFGSAQAKTGAKGKKGGPQFRLLSIERGADLNSRVLELQCRLGPAFHVFPVLRDAANHRLYPTGRVTVRFQSPLDEKEVSAFAREHGLKLAETNAFTPQQAIFEPASVEAPLLDTVAATADDARVRAAWPETAAAYERI